MKRTQVQLDEATYQFLRARAFEQGVSIASLVRDAIRAHFLVAGPEKQLRPFRFAASGRSKQGRLKPVSERHDEALEEADSR